IPRSLLRYSLFFLECYGDHRDLHSFPTRRSSDLRTCINSFDIQEGNPVKIFRHCLQVVMYYNHSFVSIPKFFENVYNGNFRNSRSEEHTSELQSRENLVCRLLLEKKKQQQG